MIGDSADIQFHCSQCGQKLRAEKAGAGLTANCPHCENPITVPRDRGYVEGSPQADGKRKEKHPAHPHSEDAAPSADHDLHDAHGESERLAAQLKKSVDERERLVANATYMEAQVRSFQADRHQLKAELGQARQQLAAAESELENAHSAIAEFTDALAASNEESAQLREQVELDHEIGRERFEATGTQIAARERELAAAQAETEEVVAALAAAQADVASLEAHGAEIRRQLSIAAQKEERLAAAEKDIEEALQLLQASESTAEALRLRCDDLEKEAQHLRSDLSNTAAGREAVELRTQLRAVEAQCDEAVSALARSEEERSTVAARDAKLCAELEDTHRLHHDAEMRAEAGSESRLNQDNAVLRGIVARQNAVTEEQHIELRRLRRARLYLRILYTLFAIALIGLTAFALKVLAPEGFGKLFDGLLE